MKHKNIHWFYKLIFAVIVTLFVMTVTDNINWNRPFQTISHCVDEERVFRSEVERTRYESGRYSAGIGSTICNKYSYQPDLDEIMLFALGIILIAGGWTISESYLRKS